MKGLAAGGTARGAPGGRSRPQDPTPGRAEPGLASSVRARRVGRGAAGRPRVVAAAIVVAVVAAAVVAASVVATAPAAAQVVRDPRVRWRTLTTRHFEIHFPTPLAPVARRVAAVAERAHATLVPLYAHAPDERTQVILTDDTDSANGSAAVLPRNTIRLFATAPEDLSPLSDHDDWMGFLVTHEHTHVLHLDTHGGIARLINALFGKTYVPNVNSPRFLIEGLAVHEESAHSAGGRLRSSIFDMYLRADALEDRLVRIDQLSNSVDRWPHGNVWYLYGSFFVEFVVDRYGRQVIPEMTHAYGSSLLPFGLNRVAIRSTGKTLVQLYEEFLVYVRALYTAQAARVEREGRVEGTPITGHGEIVRSPRFLDGETLAYWTNDGRDLPQVRAIAAGGGAPRRLGRANGDAYLSPGPGGRFVVWSTTADHRNLYFFDDLFLHDRQTGRTRRLTHGLRAREPDVSPDGRRVAFTVNGAGTTHLAIGDLADPQGTMRIVLRSDPFDQVYTPRWSPDGRHLAVSRWRRGGYRDVWLVDAATGAAWPVTEDRAFDTGPAWSPDGRLLYFSSDRTGIANVHALDRATGRLYQVTHVVTGAFSPDVSPDGTRLAYLGYGTFGWDVRVLALDPTRFREAAVFPDARPPSTPLELASPPERRYRVVDTLLPRAWSVEVGQDAFGTEVAFSTSGSDAADHHLYAARLGIGLERGNVNANVDWTIARLPTPVTLSAFHAEAPRRDLVVNGRVVPWVARTFGGAVTVSYPFLGQFHRNDVAATYARNRTVAADPVPIDPDPNAPPPLVPELGTRASLRLGWGFSDAVRTTYDVSPSWGRRLGASLAWTHPALGDPRRTVALSWTGTQYVENPLLEGHVLALRYAGGVGLGERGARPLFGVGGFPETALLDQLLEQTFLGGAALRGYPPFVRVGTAFHLVQAEYRFLLGRPQFGLFTFPFYVSRVYATAFVDAGDAYRGRFDPAALLVGVGGEVLVDFTLGYRLDYTLRLGLARGVGQGGETQAYAHLGVPF